MSKSCPTDHAAGWHTEHRALRSKVRAEGFGGEDVDVDMSTTGLNA